MMPHTFTALALTVRVDLSRREIRASLSPLPGSLLLYGAGDFQSAAGDTPEQHAEWVLEILGADPTVVLQALIDGGKLPAPPPRVPREIPNWRAKAALHGMGLLSAVDDAIAAIPDPDGAVIRLAWSGHAMLARNSATVAALATGLGLDPAALDAFFIKAADITI